IQLDLSVTYFVERTKGGNVTHARRFAEAGHTGERRYRSEHDKRDNAEVQPHKALPTRGRIIEKVATCKSSLNGIGPDVLLTLRLNIVPISHLVRLIERLPFRKGYVIGIAHLWREQLVQPHVARRPVGLSC